MRLKQVVLGLVVASVFAVLGSTRAADAPAVLRIYAWSEYIPSWLLEEFQESTGARVELRTYASNEELLTRRLDAGGFDLIQPTDYVVEGLIRQGTLEPLDRTSISNLKNLDPAFARLRHDPDGRYSVPWMAGTVGILYDTRKIRKPIHGCGDLFAGAFAGRVAAIDDPRQLFSLALASLGLPVNSVTKENLDKASDVLESWMRQIVIFDSDTPGRLVVTGDADAALVWSGEAAALMEKHPSLAYVLPAEGAFRFVDCFCIPKAAKNKALVCRL